MGAVLALFSVCLCGAYGAWGIGAWFGAAFLTAGCVKIQHVKPVWQYLLFFLWILGVTAATLSFPPAMVGAAGQVTADGAKLLLNAVCVWVLFGCLLTVTARPIASVISGTLLLLVLSTVNGFVYAFRGKELGCMDLLSVQTAFRVAGQYTPAVSFEMVRSWILALLLFFAGFAIPPLPQKRVRGASLVLSVLLFFVLRAGAAALPIKTWDNEGTRLNGYYLNFYLGVRDSAVQKPENYDSEKIEIHAQQYVMENNIRASGADLPDILVLMEESFADFRVLGQLPTSAPPTPFLDSLSDNTVRGYALTSVFGGNTANAEFEFLTGHSMAFLPENSVPYQQYIRGETRTLAWEMRANGYKTMATHPYYEKGWSRNRVYPYFGFEESTFIDAYNAEYPVRNYISDRDMFAHILNILEKNEEEKPLFLFGVTMQNHGGYDYRGEDFTESIELLDGEYPLAQQYVNLLRETDSAVEYLLTALSKREKKTVVLLFGDHFPKLETEFYEALSGGTRDTLDAQMRAYSVPFLLWANFDIEEKTIPKTSLNFLSGHLLETAGLPLSPYQRFLSQTEEKVPAMNAYGYYSPAKNRFALYAEAEAEEAKQLKLYEALVYNHMFDTKHKSKIFFGN